MNEKDHFICKDFKFVKITLHTVALVYASSPPFMTHFSLNALSTSSGEGNDDELKGKLSRPAIFDNGFELTVGKSKSRSSSSDKTSDAPSKQTHHLN